MKTIQVLGEAEGLTSCHQVESIAFTGERPWHDYGTDFAAGTPPSEVLKIADLDWQVRLESMYTRVDGQEFEVPKNKALVRDDGTFLDVVGGRWTPLQNDKAFDLFEKFCLAGQMQMETAGCLRGSGGRGAMVWALARMTGGAFDAAADDSTESFALLVNPHRYGDGIQIYFTPIRVVCNNTMTQALSARASGRVASFQHSGAFSEGAFDAALAEMAGHGEKFAEHARHLAQVQFKAGDFLSYFNAVLVPEKIRAAENFDDTKAGSRRVTKALEVLETQPGAELSTRGTAYHALNTVTYLTNHVLGNDSQTRGASTWFGQNAALNQKALDTALEFAR